MGNNKYERKIVMTQKELLYVEDVISHLDQAYQIINNLQSKIKTKEVCKVVSKVLKKTSDSYDAFMNLLEYKKECKND